MKFESLTLCEPLLKSIRAAGYQQATAIQQKAIPVVLKGRDLIGCAQTGTGKTAAFALPTLQRLMTSEPTPSGAEQRRQRSGKRAIRCLILAPTRELAGQIGESFATYGKHTKLRHTVIYGGVKQGSQVRALQAGVDTLVATPGRLLDLIGQGFVKLGAVEILILDEADQMLDMGFIHDLRKIVAQVPDERQTLMFSATMPKEIRELSAQWLRRPLEVNVAPVASTPELVSQSVCFVQKQHKAATLSRFLQSTERSKTLVFSRTKRGADKIVKFLERDGIRALAIHGNKSQNKRTAVMREFNSKRPPVLVATDLAARGLDFSDISHVINYDLPDVPETYVHRIGRTARAGASGQALSFCDRDERSQLRQIEKLTGQKVPVDKSLAVPDHLQPRGAQPKSAQPKTRQNDTREAKTTDASAGQQSRPEGAKPRSPKRRPRRNTGTGQGGTSNSSGSGSSSNGTKRRRFKKTAESKGKATPRVEKGS